MNRPSLIQVLGAVAYGEWKAYEGAQARARQAASEEERKAYRKVAAEELRHHKGFRARLEALGADPERAMRPYRASLDRYHAGEAGSPIEEAGWSYLGEGGADDLLGWLGQGGGADTAALIDTAIAREEGHQALAPPRLRAPLSRAPQPHAPGPARP